MPLPTNTSTILCAGCGSGVPAGDRFCGTCGMPITGSALISGEGERYDPWTELLQKLRQATLGEYEIRGELGRGGMAAVFLAHDLHLNRKVAIKVMLPGLAYSERMWDRFLAEARTAARLDHAHIVYVHSVKDHDRFLYFVMKYIDGRAVDDLIAQHHAFPIPVAQTLLVEVARALDYAHREGVVHRDIKPANIMIDHKGNAFVMDFGIARAHDSEHYTQTGATIGTPAYMSPEQCHAHETTAASDQYSLGVVAYELFTGVPPFTGSPIELQVAHMQELPRPIRDLRPDLSLELSGAVMRMLEKDPADRWPSLHHLVPIFARGLDQHDDAPRNHLISMVKSGPPRRQSYPETPVSPTPVDAGRTPVAPYPSRPSSATLPVSALPASAGASASASVAPSKPEGLLIGAGAFGFAESAFSGPQEAATETTMAPVMVPPVADAQAPVAAPLVSDRTRLPPARGMLIGAGVVGVAAVIGVFAMQKGSVPAPVTAPAPAPAPADSTRAAVSAIDAALGDSTVVGHGQDSLALVKGKPPKAVSADAVALLVLTSTKDRLTVGDTARIRLDAMDDSGNRVTTHQIVWTTSNPSVVRFVAPGRIVALREGTATVTVTAGSASNRLILNVRPAKVKTAK